MFPFQGEPSGHFQLNGSPVDRFPTNRESGITIVCMLLPELDSPSGNSRDPPPAINLTRNLTSDWFFKGFHCFFRGRPPFRPFSRAVFVLFRLFASPPSRPSCFAASVTAWVFFAMVRDFKPLAVCLSMSKFAHAVQNFPLALGFRLE